MSPIVEEKKKSTFRRLLFLSSDKKANNVRAVETAFIGSPRSRSTTPDTSLILEERREQLKRHDWKRAGSLRLPVERKRVSFSPTPSLPCHHHCISDTESEAGGEVRRILRPPLPKPRTLLPPKKREEEWNGEKGRTSSSQEQGGSGRSGGEEEGRRSGRSSRNRDDQRRHTLGAPDHGYQSALARSMDLEMGSKSQRRKSPQPRSYPPPNMLLDDDPGIMSEVETSSTGFRRGNKQRSSLPVVRTPSKTLERPLGLVFLQYRSETKRALLPNEITSIDTVKALFVRSFPKQLTMEYLDSPHVKIYIHDSSKDMFYELEDLRSHLRDIRDRSVLRLFESGDVVGGTAPPGSTWDQDQSYFSEPEFDSEYQHQHIHKTKGSKGPVGGGGHQPYYMTHSFPPGSLPRIGAGSLLRAYPPPPAPKPPPSVDGYMSSPERGGPRGYAGTGYPPASSYEDPYYAQYSARTGAITPVIDEEARMRVEHMERQLASLTGLVQKALNQPPATVLTPAPPLGGPPYRSASADTKPAKPAIKSSTLPRMSSQVLPIQSLPQRGPPPVSIRPQPIMKGVVGVPTRRLLPENGLTGVSDRDRHKPTPPPKPVSLSPGQYESRNVYRDLQLTAEMYNQLRGLQKKAKDLRQEVRNLRRMSQTQAHTVRETIRDTFLKIRSVLMAAGGEGLWSPAGDEARLRVNREGDLYRQQMIRLESDLTELESTVEELRGNVINRKTRVNMSDVESMALVLSKSSKTVADLKLRFPSLQDSIKALIAQEMDKMVSEEKFLKEEPERLESALRRCKKLTGTLVTLKRLASVQEQRLPDSRLSPTGIDETPPVTPTSGKAVGERSVMGEESGGGVAGGTRTENPLDALLDELQTFSKSSPSSGGTLRRLHSYPSGGSASSGRSNPPPPPPRTSSKSPLASPATESSSTESVNSQPASRQELLEQKHQELLKKQRALQEQYTRLQQLQRAPPPDLVQLKKTGSESNLLSKMGLTLAPMTGSLSHLAPTTTTTTSNSSTATTTTVNKIYETDIL